MVKRMVATSLVGSDWVLVPTTLASSSASTEEMSRNCRNIINLPDEDHERLIDVSWAAQPPEAGYAVDIEVIAADRKGLLRDISSVLADEDANVLGTNTQSDPTSDVATMRFTIEVATADQLDKLISKLRQLPDVLQVRRSR